MSVALIASIVLAPDIAPNAEVVFAARFYFPPGDKRRSYSQVYVSRLDGSKRRQLTTGNASIWSVRWVGRDHVAWIEGNDSLAIYSLGSARVVKRLARDGGFTFWESVERGSPRPWSDDRVLQADGSVKRQPELHTIGMYEGGRLKLESGETLSWKSVELDPNGWNFAFNGKSRRIRFEGRVHRIFRGKRHYAYLETYEGGGSGGSELRLYSFDPGNARARLIIDNIDGLDFDPNSRYWSGIEPWRPLVPYGRDKTVWANQIYVGNIKTGRRWLIAKGQVLGQSVQIRPGL